MATSSSSRSIFTNTLANTYTVPTTCLPPTTEISAFHSEISEYFPTPLIPLPNIAKSLHLGNLLIKDEHLRFGLPSFKSLGISWAIRNALIAELSEFQPVPLPSDISLPELAAKTKDAQIKLVAATDGKLGRIVAKMGKSLGVSSINTRIFVGDDLNDEVKEGIKREGAEVITVQGDFEVAVREAWLHSVATDGVLVSFDSEENYEDIPRWIVEGYSTIFHELNSQLPSPPNLIILPVGIGGLVQAAVTNYKSPFKPSSITRILTVEPEVAACLHSSLRVGQRITVEPKETILKHLNYDAVSEAAWEILKDGVDASTVVLDSEAQTAVRELRENDVDVGVCGGAVLAGLKSIIGTESFAALGLNASATVVLVCTDGINN